MFYFFWENMLIIFTISTIKPFSLLPLQKHLTTQFALVILLPTVFCAFCNCAEIKIQKWSLKRSPNLWSTSALMFSLSGLINLELYSIKWHNVNRS